MATLAELIGTALPSTVRVLAAAEALQQPVRGVRTVRRPDAEIGQVQAGELVLLADGALRSGGVPALEATLRALASRSPAAVALHTFGTNLADVAPAGIPLLLLPRRVALAPVAATVARFLAESEARDQQRRHHLHRTFVDLATQGANLPSIAERLAALTERAVLIEDASHQLHSVAPNTATTWSEADIAAELQSRGGNLEQALVPAIGDEQAIPDLPVATVAWSLDPDRRRLVAPIQAGTGLWGYLSLLVEGSHAGYEDEAALRAAAVACAVAASREEAIGAAELAIQVDLIEALAAGGARGQRALTQARRMGYDPGATYVAVALEWDSTAGAATRAPQAVRMELARRDLAAPYRVDEGILILLPLPGGDSAALQRLAGSLHRGLEQALGRSLSAGTSRPCSGLAEASRAAPAAQRALALGRTLFGPGRLTPIEELGVYRLLTAVEDDTALQQFYEQTLGRLPAHERGALEPLRTLEAYFATLGSPKEAALRLGLHRNTLLYRLHRIEALLGRPLDDAETRLALHLALRVGEVLRARHEQRGDLPPSLKMVHDQPGGDNARIGGEDNRPADRIDRAPPRSRRS